MNNLLSNAIKHNIKKDGLIMVQLEENQLIIKNTGEELNILEDSLFLRFKKNKQNESSHGLGLAICKRICDYHHFKISYKQENELHTIIVQF
jgi:signal transduction histidine kinase